MVRMGCRCCFTALVRVLYGCSCKKSDKRSTELSERVWFCFLVLSLLLTFINMYLWLVSINEADLFDLGFWSNYHLEFKWHFAFLTASFVLFGYPFILMMFALLHMILKEHLHLNVIHKVMLVLVDTITVTILVLSVLNTRFLWHFIPLSLMFFGPFLHLIAVIVMTLGTWFVAGAFGTLERKGGANMKPNHWYETTTLLPQEIVVDDSISTPNRYIRRRPQVNFRSPSHVLGYIFSNTTDESKSTGKQKRNPVRDMTLWYIILLLALYLCPLFISSPCILDDKDLTPKPRLFAHKGAEHLAPENTLVAFQTAVDDCEVYGLESDVRISADGVHVCMHDNTLERTTNVEDVFPERVKALVEHFTSQDLALLNAGEWFLEKDPFGTASELTEEKRKEYKEQNVPKMTDMLDIAMKANVNILFDLQPPPEGHPYEKNFVDYTVGKLRLHGIKESEMDIWQAPNGPHYVVFIKKFDDRTLENVYNAVPLHSIREKNEKQISTNVWTINQKWVFSLFWCGQTFSVTTAYCRDLKQMKEPSWQLTKTHYLIMWIMYDTVSFIWVVIFLVCQIRRKRKRGSMVIEDEILQETALIE